MRWKFNKKIFNYFFIAILIVGFVLSNKINLEKNIAFANDKEINNLNAQIDEKRRQLQQIEAQIAEQRRALLNVSGTANTLQSTLNQLEATRKKILSDISYTETKIKELELNITKLSIEIREKNELIKTNSVALGSAIRKLKELKNTSVVEQILGYENMSDFWLNYEQTENIQKQINLEIEKLLRLKKELEESEIKQKEQKENLSQYQKELAGEKEAVEYTSREKETLLKQTRNQEAEYQKILAESLRRKNAFEQELLDIESKLNLLIDPQSYPAPRNGILAWPLDTVRITQEFGGTQFAKTNPHIYGRAFHPGTDFGVPIGTQVKSVLGGKITATGNTDAYPGCYAWGKWILVEHFNGLSSLYAHLSSINVTPGQEVKTGQVIGLSGNTGVSTGPHLHLTIYATQGVRVGKYGSYRPGGTGCAATDATGPFADLNAYLDPMLYLPKL